MQEWKKNIRKIDPYVAGEQPQGENIIKLNTNENPYPPSAELIKMINTIDMGKNKLYPDPASTKLVKELAAFYNVDENMIFTGVGSDDVLAIAFQTFFNSTKPIVFPDLTYSFYPVWADLYRIPYKNYKLNDDWTINPKDYYKENGGVVLANPNAPTSICEPVEVIEDIILHNQDCVVIIDEAYIDFGGESVVDLTRKYENLLVVQTFSKSRSLAGMRIGYAIGNKDLIKAMVDIKYSTNSYHLNYLSNELGAAAVKDKEYFYTNCKKVIATREKYAEKLKKLGFVFPKSSANFLFITHKDIAAKIIFTQLREKNIFVRFWDKPGLSNYMRVTIGTDDQMERLCEALEEIINEAKVK